jgi:hypothetical protein
MFKICKKKPDDISVENIKILKKYKCNDGITLEN